MPNATLLLCALLAAAAPPGPQKVDLPALLQRARSQPAVETARAAARQAHAKAREVGRMWLPRLEVTAVGGPSQRVTCLPSAEQCITTEPDQLGLGFDGVFGRIDGQLLMPLYTFGKLTAGQRAADAGAQAQDALAESAAEGAVVDAAKAYFAVKLGRELLLMLDEGKDRIDEELAREEELLEKGSGEVTEIDHRRILTLRAELMSRRSEAQKVEELGLAGVHYTLGTDAVEVDDLPLKPIAYSLPSVAEARARALKRPETRAAAAGVEAMAGLTELEWAKWWPDFVLIGQGTFAGSTSVEHPQNAFLTDPYNAKTGVVGVILRWAPEPFLRGPKIDQAEAEEAKAKATADMAREGLPAEAERALAEARDARDRMSAARDGQRHGKAWLASVLQSEAAGLVEAKELADALLQYFLMRARLIQATFEWNVGVIALQRAMGEQPSQVRYVEEE